MKLLYLSIFLFLFSLLHNCTTNNPLVSNSDVPPKDTLSTRDSIQIPAKDPNLVPDIDTIITCQELPSNIPSRINSCNTHTPIYYRGQIKKVTDFSCDSNGFKAVITEISDFNPFGKIIANCYNNWNTNYVYFFDNTMKMVKMTWEDKSTSVTGVHTWEYDTLGFLVSNHFSSSDNNHNGLRRFKCDSIGQVIEEKSYFDIDTNKVTSLIKFKYDNYGNIIETNICHTNDGTVYLSEICKYDDIGDILYKKTLFGDVCLFQYLCYDKNGNWTKRRCVYKKYDADTVLISESVYLEGRKIEYFQ